MYPSSALVWHVVRLAATLSFLICLGACASSESTRPAIRVGVIGDQTGASNLDAAYVTLERAVRRLNTENITLALHTGDLVESAQDPEEYRRTFQRAVAILDQLAVPWHLTPGDHDVNPPPPFTPDSSDRSREELFRELYVRERRKDAENLYYSFDAAGYHFIALNSQEVLHADPRWGAVLLAALSDAQRDWLLADLEQHRASRGMVVFLHQPLWYNWTRWSEIHAALRRYPVVAVIAGHFHYNQDDGLIDGIRYVTVGAAGGNTKNGSRAAGHLQHVTVLTLRDRKAEFAVLPLDTDERLALTPRADMDRVQMLDLVLGTLWDFEAANPVFRKGDTLVAACDSTDPPRIKLVALGNPLDVTLTVTVRADSAGIGLRNSRFAPGSCLGGEEPGRCELRRGSRITIANLSSVEMTWGCAAGCAPPEPLWTAAVVSTAGDPIPQTVGLAVRLSFAGKSGELFLEQKVSTRVRACP